MRQCKLDPSHDAVNSNVDMYIVQSVTPLYRASINASWEQCMLEAGSGQVGLAEAPINAQRHIAVNG